MPDADQPNITHTHFRDTYGRLMWVEPLREEFRLYQVGEEFVMDDVRYRVERCAIAENTQHVNVLLVAERLNIVEPWL